jgi:hypothetical protein
MSLGWCEAGREARHQPAGYRGVDESVAARRDTDGGDEFLGRQALEQETAGSRGERPVNVLIGVECGEHQDAGAVG